MAQLNHAELPASKNIRLDTLPKNSNGMKSRNYLRETEVELLIEAARKGKRKGDILRNQTMILMAFRHGLRCSEICNLQWNQVDLDNYTLDVFRMKNGKSSVHPLRDREIRLLRRIWKERTTTSPYIFLTNRGGPLSRLTFHRLIGILGVEAGLPLKTYPHMLRHGVGFKLVSEGVDTRRIQDYLGHVCINNTVKYTTLLDNKFQGFFKD